MKWRVCDIRMPNVVAWWELRSNEITRNHKSSFSYFDNRKGFVPLVTDRTMVIIMGKKLPCDILIRHAMVLSPDMTIKKNQLIAISEGKLLNIKADGDDVPYVATKQTFEDDHLLWMPGLTDGHIHTSQQFLRGRLLDVRPVVWKRVNVPFESCLNSELSKLSASLAALEMISSGTTSFLDAGGKYPEAFAEVYGESGLRGFLTVMTNDSPNAPESLRTASPEEGVKRLRDMKDLLISLGRRIQPIYSVTTPTAVSESLLRMVLEASIEDHIPFETHLNEYASEVVEFIEKYGKRPFLWLEDEKLIPQTMIAAHAVFLSQEEMDVLQRNRILVVHCPFSNCGKGVPSTPQLIHMGISCGFGSDGAGHGGLDLFREVRLFRSLMQVERGVPSADSSVMSAETLLHMAACGGASELFCKLAERLTPGAPADLIAIDTDSPNLWPSQNLVHSLVECASGSNVRHSIINGRLIMKDRDILTLDTEKIRYNVKKAVNEFPWLTSWNE